MKKIVSTVFVLCLSVILFAQNKEADKGIEAVKAVLKQYNSAIEKLDVSGTEKLFTADSKIFESGGIEGTYAHYLEHHLMPELKEFKSFRFSDYKVDAQVDGNYAFTTETYNYIIIVAKNNTEVKRKGVATSVLKKVKGEWKIIINHSSSRK